MKLYIWDGVLTDWTSGAIFVVAPTLAEARKAVLAEHDSDSVRADIAARPRILDLSKVKKPEAWLVWGGA